jgi:small subunit ribosomal protein S4e
MHLTRSESTKKWPIPRKGTRYLARPTGSVNDSVPVVIAVRDMLKLARTAKEVNEMVKQKLLKINGREVKDYHESIQLFNILEADKSYVLKITTTGKFVFEHSSKKERLCKVINKTLLKGNKTQLNLHDGSNVITSDKIQTNDTVYLDFSGKILRHIPMQKGKEVFIMAGAFKGQKGKIEEVEDSRVAVAFEKSDNSTKLKKREVIVI